MTREEQALNIIFNREINITNLGVRYEDYIKGIWDTKLIPTREEYLLVLAMRDKVLNK